MGPSNYTQNPIVRQALAVSFLPIYEFYTGPKLAELDAIRASAEVSRDGKFTFTGTNQGRINKAPAVYVWGIDRNGNLPPGPFTNRPNITFDAVVIVTLGPTHHLTAEVVDLANGNSTNLPSGSARIKGSTVSVTVPSSLLPSTGLPTSQYHFNTGQRMAVPQFRPPWRASHPSLPLRRWESWDDHVAAQMITPAAKRAAARGGCFVIFPAMLFARTPSVQPNHPFEGQRPDTQLRIRAFCPGIFAFLAVFRVVVEGGRMCPQVQSLQQLNPSMAEHPSA